MNSTSQGFNWLIKVEPRLGALQLQAKTIKDDGSKSAFCANHRWYGCSGCEVCGGGLKSVLTQLVGWEAEDPTLRTTSAYDVAYDAIYSALPPCRNCSCL